MALADKSIELSGFGTLTGTPDQVRNKLARQTAEQVIALTVEHGSALAVGALAETVAGIAPLVGSILAHRQRQTIQAIVEALVPQVPPPRHVLIEARMTAEARNAVLESGDWVTAAQVSELAGFSASNPSAQPNRWKREGLIFAVRHRGMDYFPDYGLDAATGYRPVKGLALVLGVFDKRKDDWGLAYWFASANGFLGGKRPQDLLKDEAERVRAAAEDETAIIAHG